MLTLESILRTTRHNSAFGDTGRHQFGKESPQQNIPVPRDHDARPKTGNQDPDPAE